MIGGSAQGPGRCAKTVGHVRAAAELQTVDGGQYRGRLSC